MKRLFEKMNPAGKRGKERGMSIVLASVAMIFTMSMIGLSVDAGSAYVIKAGLSAAADAAALAAGRSVVLGNTEAAAKASATASAQRFFNANFPNGFMNVNTSTMSLLTDFVMSKDGNGQPTGILKVTVAVSVQAPTYFMRFLHGPQMTIKATGVTTRKSLVMMIVLDRSGSMETRETSVGTVPTSPGETGCEAMVYGAIQFIDMFSPYDFAGLISYAERPSLDFALQTDFKRANGIKTSIANIQCGGSTNTTGALWMANQQLVNRNLPLAVNAIVFFSDGAPNGISAQWPIKRSVDNRYGKVPSSGNPATPTSPQPPNSPTGTNGNWANCIGRFDRVCQGVPVRCASSTPEPIAQLTSDGDLLGDRSALGQSMPGDASNLRTLPSGCPTSAANLTTSSIAFIPQFDRWGNRTWGHNPPFKDNWAFAVNNKCAPSGANLTPGAPQCRFVGGTFASYPTSGAGTNFYTSGPYAGRLRVDTPNALRVAGMNSAMSMADTIRANTTLKPYVYTMFLMNGTDAIDRDFMPIVANVPNIPALPWDANAAVKPNPYYNPAQQTGLYTPLSNRDDLVPAFQAIAASLLRISE
jgi:Flp pilus assembly protein TadG